MENVLGILSMRKGEAIKEIVQSFEEVGYHVNPPMKLKAEEFGVPQRRRRVLIIGSLKNIKLEQPKPLFSDTDVSLPTPITVEEAIGDLPPLEPGTGVEIIDVEQSKLSTYGEFIQNKINFEEFYRRVKNLQR